MSDAYLGMHAQVGTIASLLEAHHGYGHKRFVWGPQMIDYRCSPRQTHHRNETAMPQLNHDNNHTCHAPTPAQAAAYPRIREKSKELAILIDELCKDSRERSTAHTYLETAVMWANASIARNGLNGEIQT